MGDDDGMDCGEDELNEREVESPDKQNFDFVKST